MTKEAEESGIRLLACWEPPDGAGAPVGCVATTFTFDGALFEEKCLSRFAGIDSDAAEDPRAYVVEREEKLSQVFACVLVDRAHVAAHRSLRWHQLPVTVPGGGILHAKVSLLVWQHAIRVLIGSANLTEPGYRRNFEQMAVLDFAETSSLPVPLLGEVLDFLRELGDFVPGGEEQGHPDPRRGLLEFLERVRRQTQTWPHTGWARGEARAEFLPVLPGRPSLFRHLLDKAWKGTGPDEARVLSPFFDPGDGAVKTVAALVEHMAFQGRRSVQLFGPGRRLADGIIELDVPQCLQGARLHRVDCAFGMVGSKDAAGEMRDLHAKSLWLCRGAQAVMTVGSSNFTAAGTGIVPGHSNIEANLAYVIPDKRAAFGRKCSRSSPPTEELDLDRQRVVFASEVAPATPDPTEFQPLPPAFGLALYVPDPTNQRLSLAIDPGAPAGFQVQHETTGLLLDHERWQGLRAAVRFEVPWSHPRPPSSLIVSWPRADGSTARALWVVNVTDQGRLPPPEELAQLTLEELLEVLTSARPLHEAVKAVLDRKSIVPAPGKEVVVDPHRKVDTSNFLLRRVRRLSHALEGLHERLQRPVFTRDALRWRLHGPFGPLALARRLADNEGQGAAFMIAEVALTVRHVDLVPLEQALGREHLRGEIDGVLAELEALAARHPSPPNLAAYVERCFAEVHP